MISSKQCCKINPTLHDKDGPVFNTNVKYAELILGFIDTDGNIDTVDSVHCSKHNFGLQSYDHDNCSDDVYDPQGQLSTAISKVQIQLNNLINNHKASLKLYDDIINLFNDYVSSPNFDGTKIISHAHPCFQGKKWYDWAYVHFEELNAAGIVVENYYPANL